MTKQELRDALHLLLNTPSHCVCGQTFTTDHTMICRHGVLIFACHNDLCDITADLLSTVCNDVAIEPPLTPRSPNLQDDARADIHACGLWGWRQNAFFDVRVFLLNAQSYSNASILSVYIRNEMQKKREYGDRVQEEELASLLHWFLQQLGAWEKRQSLFIDSLLSFSPNKYFILQHHTGMASMHSVFLLCSATMCIRRSCSISYTDDLMLLQKWVLSVALGTPSCPLIVVLLYLYDLHLNNTLNTKVTKSLIKKN